jgi:bifunctional UDP-N-acetylglucosamine pyrophosphorylase/glucosamine-1-phosphate N-acetyltransferase
VKVGASVEVKNSIIMAKTHVPHHNYVGDSLIGERCNFGAGTKVANLRFDDRPVKVTFKGQLIDSGRRKLGVIMGDDVKTGINAMIDPGTIIFENTFVGPGAVVRGNVGPGSRVL